MRSHRRVWVVFATAALCVVAALAWITYAVTRLEGEAIRAQVEKQRSDDVHLALWRMDAWVAARIAAEAARPARHYSTFFEDLVESAADEGPNTPQSVTQRSPLANFRSPLVRLHFQVFADDTTTSPQAPEVGVFRHLAESQRVPPEFIDENTRVMSGLAEHLRYEDLCARLGELEDAISVEPAQLVADGQSALNRNLQQQRGQQLVGMRYQVANAGPDLESASAASEVGPFVAVWLGGDPGERLAIVRRARRGGRAAVQGFLVDWNELQRALLKTVGDELPGVSLRAVEESRVAADTTGRVLASVPVELVVPPVAIPSAPAMSWSRAAVLLAWLAMLSALGASMFSVRASLLHAERRDRFASAVTHELRTPLTSFRMVADLLADDMIPDPARRQEHLESLRGEAERLSNIVENVLGYARVERGGAPVRAEASTLGALAARIEPVLRRRSERDAVAFAFDVQGDGGAPVTTDPDVLQRIAGNLVDNACKYGGPAAANRVAVVLRLATGALEVEVSDGGGGVPARLVDAVFEPFDRGAHTADGATPGVGLGLPLSRALARRLGGDLVLLQGGPGARFRLRIPV